jgi:integrase
MINRMARKAKQEGQLIWRKDGWSGRYRTTVDGELIRVCVPLGTTNKAVARVKLERLIAGTSAKETVAVESETFEQAARRIVPTQGVKTADERIRRLEMYAFPRIGKRPIDKILAADIRDIVENVSKKLSLTTVGHILADISGVLGHLYRREMIPENVAEKILLSEDARAAKVDDRPRVVLTDDEFAQFVAWPKLDPELRLMALTARCFGGMRTSDLHAWDWSHIDWARLDAHVPRPKTKTRDRLALPELILPALRAWWQAADCASEGPVFPERHAGRAGERRGKRSHARRLRIALWNAGVRRGKTKESCELQTDTQDTKRVDFHSFRRAFNTALAGAGVNVQLAMKLAGHRNASTHMRYVHLTESTPMPEQALPDLTWAPSVPIIADMASQSILQVTGMIERPQRDLNPCYRRERPMS